MKILITGISQGLGRHLAVYLLEQDHEVWGISRKERDHKSIEDLLQYPKFIYSSCDLTKENQIIQLAEDVKRSNFSMDVLILNAALMENDYINDQWDYTKFKEIMEVNLMGTASLTSKLLPLFQQQKKGIIIGISSTSAIRALLANKIAYAASKAALNMVFEALRLQLGYSYPGIRFITVVPGPIERKDQPFSISYAKITKKICSIIQNNKYKRIYTFPMISSVIYRIFRIIPDCIIAKYIIQPRRRMQRDEIKAKKSIRHKEKLGNKIRHCLVIGSSRGLGAALVEELLKEEDIYIIGFARSDTKDIKNHEQWFATKRYRYIKVDITTPECTKILKTICSELVGEPIMIILNAALVKSDSSPNKRIIYPVMDEINQIAIQGFRRVLEGIEEHMLNFGGIFIGISAFSAISPPVQELRLAYPATKAYLDMALRCLRFAWMKKVKVVTIHLGHLDSLGDGRRYWFVPDYTQTARKITKVLGQKNIPDEINYPFLYNLFYKHLIIFVPDRVYYWFINLLGKFMHKQSV